ncbi:hypothetical protein AB1Y20_021474 [Prymnesium parvum]|uniref:2-dehydropantoate 2-reductase n=1 Tax=Prymnesium parvum TaxID=97485 RepID=A0AB34JJM9_PRYPA
MHVLGAGALGSLWGAHASQCTMLLRPGSAEAQSRRLLVRVTRGWTPGHTHHEVSLPAEAADENGVIDHLLVATKAFHVQEAIDSVRHRLDAQATVVLLCNGALSVAEEIDLPQNAVLLAATTTHGCWLQPSPHRTTRLVYHAGNGETWVGPLPRAGVRCMVASPSHRHSHSSPNLTEDGWESKRCAQFAAHGLGAHIEASSATLRRLWLKLAANAVLNPLTALWDVPNGEVLQRAQGRALASEICREIAALASQLFTQHENVQTPTALELNNFVEGCAAANAANWSSMHQDVKFKRRTEIDHLNGWVVKRAMALGINCEVNADLVAHISQMSQMPSRTSHED